MASKRGYVRQEIRRASSSIVKAEQHLGVVAAMYEHEYPEVAQMMIMLITTLKNIDEALVELHEEV